MNYWRWMSVAMGINLAAGVYAQAATVSSPQSVSFSMVGSNAIDQELPYGVLRGEKFTAIPNARYVKIHLFPDQPIVGGLRRIEIESCGQWIKWVDAFINFDEMALHVDNEARQAYAKKSGKTVSIDVDEANPVHSITLNFQNQNQICIQSIKLIDGKDRPIAVTAPKIWKGTVEASSTLAPKTAYDAAHLFDSRFENAWASNKETIGTELNFRFAQSVRVTALRFWNGYQRSALHCQQNSRIQQLSLKGANYSETISLKDEMGAQTVMLPRPFQGDHLTLHVEKSYRGSRYAEVVLSEMRFLDGDAVFLLSPLPHLQRVQQETRDAFAKAGLAHVLNTELHDESEFWAFRLRSDGTLYIQGTVAKEEDAKSVRKDDEALTSYTYSVLGGYEILRALPEQIQLRVFGFLKRVEGEYSGDCNGCGFACNGSNTPAGPGIDQRIFQDFITLKLKSDGTIEAKNTKPQHRLPFETLQFVSPE